MPVQEIVLADSQGRITPSGNPPVFNPQQRPKVSLLCLTSVPSRYPFTSFGAAFAAHCAFREKALSNPDVREIRTREDLLNGDGTIGILFGIQNAPEDLTDESLQALYTEGVRSMSIGVPKYGGGFEHANEPLTEAGKALLRQMAAHRFILNLSGMGHRTMLDALTLIRSENLNLRPMASHSGCSKIFEHERNLPDGILKGIADLHGYVGIPLSTALLGRQPCLDKKQLDDYYFEKFESHIAHASCVMGGKRVGIGSDCIHQDMPLETAEKLFKRVTSEKGLQGGLRRIFPNSPPEIIESGSRMFEVLTKKLTLHSEVLGENLFEFLKSALRRPT